MSENDEIETMESLKVSHKDTNKQATGTMYQNSSRIQPESNQNNRNSRDETRKVNKQKSKQTNKPINRSINKNKVKMLKNLGISESEH